MFDFLYGFIKTAFQNPCACPPDFTEEECEEWCEKYRNYPGMGHMILNPTPPDLPGPTEDGEGEGEGGDGEGGDFGMSGSPNGGGST